MTDALVDLSTQPPASRVGGKAARLGRLMGQGWPVPSAVAVPFETIAGLADGDPATLSQLTEDLATWMTPHRQYVVRSSADVEDHGQQTFAGQFASVAGVADTPGAIAAVHTVIASAATPQVRQYARRVGVDPAALRMAVIVQEMVVPVVSGVAFSRDPVTGADRVIVEAVVGVGDRLMGRGATPQRWSTGADGDDEQPTSPVMPASVHRRVVNTVRSVARATGETVDLEWVWDGRQVQVVQWRPVSSRTRKPRVWSSRMARDMLPGLIPPLVWSVNVPVLSRTWVGIVHEAIGDTDLTADELVRPFGYRAYFNATAFGQVFESLGMPEDAMERMRDGSSESTMRPSLTALVHRGPVMARFARSLWTWPRHALPVLAEVERQQRLEQSIEVPALTDTQLIERVERLRRVLAQIARLNIITPLLADGWASAIRRTAKRAGIDPESVDPGQELAAVRSLSPAHVLSTIDLRDDRAWAQFLERFGHLSDSPNDCSRPTWAEQPDAVRVSLAGRPEVEHGPRVSFAVADRTGGSTKISSARTELLAAVPPWRRRRVARMWSRIALLRLVRERIGYTYARVYALFRPTFLEIGRRLVARDTLTDPEDVFLLTLQEVRSAVQGQLPRAAALVSARRTEMAEAEGLHWPERIVGDDPVPVRGRAGATVLHGVPTSHGRHTGPARVVTSLADACEIGPDDVLILPAADVTWTPLLLRAGAVITETGGMLSHASIVARELGLACVAGVDGATRIPQGTTLGVDGAAGEVVLLQVTGLEEQEADA